MYLGTKLTAHDKLRHLFNLIRFETNEGLVVVEPAGTLRLGGLDKDELSPAGETMGQTRQSGFLVKKETTGTQCGRQTPMLCLAYCETEAWMAYDVRSDGPGKGEVLQSQRVESQHGDQCIPLWSRRWTPELR